MRYFICAMDGINLGVPAEWTERVISASQAQGASGETALCISIPALLRNKDAAAPHALVMKSDTIAESPSSQVKTILLVPKIDIDLQIPEENIHALPKVLKDFLQYFRGAYFAAKESPAAAGQMILILDPRQLITDTRRKADGGERP